MKPSTVFLFTALATAFACASSDEDGGGSGGSTSSNSSSSSSGSGGEGPSSSSSGSSSSSSSSGGPGGSGGSAEGGAGGASPNGGAATGGTGGDGGTAGTGGGAGGTGGAGCAAFGCVDDPDPNTRCSGSDVVTPIVPPAGAAWATSVVTFSSEYSTPSWGAIQALGAPDTYPTAGDETTAWASNLADSPGESITLAFAPPAAGSQIWIFETYNPDAVSRVTVSTASGDTVVYDVVPASVGDCAYVLGVPTNTADPVTQVKIDLASDIVDGWNEIDAVAVIP